MKELILANIIFSIFFIAYLFGLRHLTFFRINRFFLIGALLISVIIPFITFSEINANIGAIPEVVLPTLIVDQTESIQSNELLFINVAYWAGVVISLLAMLFGLFRILIKSFSKDNKMEDDYLISPGAHAYSFFNRIHIGTDIPRELRTMISMHERAHTRGVHSFDVLLFSVAKVFCWFNPFIHWAFKELRLNHEYIADEITYRDFGTDYQYSILNQALETQVFQLSNSFYSKSLVKKRIVMMNKSESPISKSLRYLFVFPIIALGVWIVACNQQPGLPVETQTEVSMNEVMKPSSSVHIAKEVDVLPEFPGGQEGMLTFFKEGFSYPEELKEDNVEGRVAISFVVHEDGSTSDFEPVSSDDKRLEAPAIAFLKNMPDWNPGTIEGEPVKVKMILPVQYTMN